MSLRSRQGRMGIASTRGSKVVGHRALSAGPGKAEGTAAARTDGARQTVTVVGRRPGADPGKGCRADPRPSLSVGGPTRIRRRPTRSD